MAKNLLIIDNEGLSETVREIKDLCTRKNFAVECYPFYIGLPEGNNVINNEGKIDIELIKREFTNKYGSIRFHMVASDFVLNDEKIDGTNIINLFNNFPNTKKSKKILYSSEIDEIIESYLNKYKEGAADFENTWENFKTLIRIEIIDFVKRDAIEKKIADNIEKVEDDSDDFIMENLLANSDLKFKKLLEIYEGKTFSEIATLIKQEDSQSVNFKKKLIEYSIANLSELNDE